MSVYSDSNVLGGGFPGFGGGFGGGWGNSIAPIGLFGVANGLFGRDGGRGDCNRDCGGDGLAGTILGANILEGLGDLKGSVPLAAAQIENSLLTQTAGLTSSINSAGLANLAATAGVKDTVTNAATAALINANNNTNSILSAICGLGSKIDANTITDLQTQLLRAESHGRSRETEVNITQSVNQNTAQLQAQQQQQAQFNTLLSTFANLAGDIQAIKQSSVVFNSGTMAASGNQGAANTRVA